MVSQAPEGALPQRKAQRLPYYDYAAHGMYFVTLCAHNRASTFGRIINAKLLPSPLGLIVMQCWKDIPLHNPHVVLDEFAVMPNHLHGLLYLAAQGNEPEPDRRGISTIISLYKAAVTRQAARHSATPNGQVWQRGFFDHVVRHDDDLCRIREYIATNPLRWEFDRENPRHSGLDEFDSWLDAFTVRPLP